MPGVKLSPGGEGPFCKFSISNKWLGKPGVRINRLILDAVLQARPVELAFCSTVSRKEVESKIITSFRPLWNRATPRRNVGRSTETTNLSTPTTELRPARAPTCREQILKTARDVVREKGRNEFTVPEIISRLQNVGTDCSEGAIRTHITWRCCRNAPKNHAVTYEDYERTARGLYRLL